jgi:hypothetical protein
MLRAAPGPLFVLALAASAAEAAPILYATAATTGEVTSYCVGAGGGLVAAPRQRIQTLGNAPSRVITTTLPGGQFLYVAENDRVEVFRIGDGGRLTRQGRIPALPLPNDPGSGLTGMNPHDLSIGQNADGSQVLYVPQRAFDRIATFPLDPATGLSTVRTGVCTTATECVAAADCAAGQSCVAGRCVEGSACTTDAGCGSNQTCESGVCVAICDPRAADPNAACAGAANTCVPVSDQTGSSCVLGPVPSEWEDLKAATGLVYTSRAVTRGEVFVYQLVANGNFADGNVVVTETIGGDVNPTQCTRSKGCTTGMACSVDAGCVGGPGEVQRCVAGSCVNLSAACERDRDCTQGQTCEAFGPCDQNGKAYVVQSEDCTTAIVLTDMNGQPITRPATANDPSPNPLTVRGQIEPYARRRRLNGASALILRGEILYVSERFRRAISALELCPAGGQPPVCPGTQGKKGTRCTCPDANRDGIPDVPDLCPAGGFSVDAKVNADGVCTVRDRQPRLAKRGGRTESDIRYNAMILAQGMTASTILGAQFLDGRIDGYRLKDDGRLPREPTRRTSGNFRTSPFHVFVYRPPDVRPDDSAGVLYVGAGDADRVQAYRLDRNGLPRDRNPFSESETLSDTFPNDVTIIDLPGPCS